MEGESDMDEERELEFEDIDLSDTESTTEDTVDDPISIDCNSRISSNTPTYVKADDDEYYENISNISRFQPADQDSHGDTSCEEFNMSDEDLPASEFVNMQRVILDGMSCFASKHYSDVGSSYNHSSTNFKNGTECVSTDEQTNTGRERHLNSCEGPVRRLSFGLSVQDVVSNKDGISVNRPHMTSFNFANSYCDSIMLKKRSSNVLDPSDTTSSLMTCLEFLKSDISEDDGTDVEEFSIDDSGDYVEKADDTEVPQAINNVEKAENSIRYRGVSDFFDVHSRRKSSLTTELLIDDADDAELFQSQRNRKRSSIGGEYKSDCPTDEEDIDLLDLKEWTETDESGDVRQITHIKTETSIKLEGDGDGAAFDSDDLVSTTATTTTRVVTSVITDPNDESGIDSTFVQQVSEDGIRQSCEITFSEVLNESSSSKPGESGCEE